MKVLHGFNNLPKLKNPVVALGVFDGVHRGHIGILRAAAKRARDIRGTSVVLTFWPHPQKEKSIYSLEHRLRLIAEQGIDACVVINFSNTFAKISSEEFIRRILCEKIGAAAIFVGENFKFGKNAAGDSRLLKKFSGLCGFSMKNFRVVKINNKPISSTYIRELIRKGGLAAAQRLLTRPVSILGTVIKGESLATKMGYPTANINPHHEVIPPDGIYAVEIIYNKRKLKGICYIGIKPTVRYLLSKPVGEDRRHIEVHIFGFRKNIYGRYLEIQFVKKIREDKKFASTPALIEQIEKDVISAKGILSPHF